MRIDTNYSVASYGEMLTDGERLTAYTSALDRLITPESAVLDIGCGTGFFVFYAARLGARKVIGIEANEALDVARGLATANGFGDEVEFRMGLSTELEFDEPFDVIISDLRGVLPLFGHHISSLTDARTRLLKPGGSVLPARDSIYMALAESERARNAALGPDVSDLYGIDMRVADRAAAGGGWWSGDLLRHDDLRSDPALWAVVDYGARTEPDVRGEVALTATTDCRVDGLAVWFDAEIHDGLGYSNKPRRADSTYGHAFFPVEQAFDVVAGSTVHAHLEARLVGDEYVWRWTVRALDPGGSEVAQSKGSTSLAGLDSIGKLHRRSEHFVPELSPAGEAAREVLANLDGRADLGAIARKLTEQHPGRWDRWESALAEAADIAELYAR